MPGRTTSGGASVNPPRDAEADGIALARHKGAVGDGKSGQITGAEARPFDHMVDAPRRPQWVDHRPCRLLGERRMVVGDPLGDVARDIVQAVELAG